MDLQNSLYRAFYYLTFLVLVIFNITDTIAQNGQLKFTNISVAQGLSQSTVFAITQDSKGFMWFGTRTGGLNRYDGRSFKAYKNDFEDLYSISGNEILTIFEDSKGRFWVGTRGFGLNRFDYEKERFYNYLNHQSPNNNKDLKTVTSIVEDYKGRIWLTTLGGLCLYDELTDSFSIIPNKITGLTFTGNSSLCLVRDSILCIGNKKGAHLFNTNSKEVFKEFKHQPENPLSISNNRINSLLYDSNDRLWIGTRNNGLNLLHDISDSNFVRFEHDPLDDQSLGHNVIRVITEDQKGALWIGTSGGLDQLIANQIDQERPVFIHHKNDTDNKNSLSQNVIFDCFEDNRGDLWLGTWSRGIDYLNVYNKKFEHFRYNIDKTQGLYHDNVTCFTENSQGIWIGTDNGGVSLLSRKSNTFVKHIRSVEYPDILKNDHIRCLYTEADNSLWIGTFDGLTSFNPQINTGEHFFENQQINSIANGPGDILWVGSGKGLIKFNKKTHSYVTYKRDDSDSTALADNTINFIHCDVNNNMWIGTKRGLHLYNEEEDNFIRFNHSTTALKTISNDHIVTMANDLDGNLWIGTYDGLNKFNTEDSSFIHFSEKNGLPDNVISGIVAGNQGGIWLSTNNGLVEFNQLKNSINDSINIRVFTEEDGLQGNEFIRHSQFKTKNGAILFGGLKGFNLFYPDSIKSNLNKPSSILTDLKLFNQSVIIDDDSQLLSKHISLTRDIRLNHTQSVVTFCFAALSYTSPQKNKFAYRMEGFEDNWNYVGNKNEATYTSLPAGNYTFRVKASNNDGIWDNKGTAIDIMVLPPWWESWEFRTVLTLLIVCLIISIYLVRVRLLNRQRAELKLMVAQRTVELQDVNTVLEGKHEELEAQRNEIQAAYNNVEKLNRIGKEITMSLSVENIIKITYQEIKSMMEVPFFSIGIYDSEKESLVFKGSLLNGKKTKDFEYSLDDRSKVGVWCFNNQENVLINNLREEYSPYINKVKSHVALNETPNSVIYLPLNVKDKKIGVISIQSSMKDNYTKYHQDILQNVAIYLAIALDNADAYDKIEKQTVDLININIELKEEQNQVEQKIIELSLSQEEQSRLNTQLKSINKQLTKQQEELESAINQLKDAQSQLLHAEKMASIGVLTAGVAHEINNPLNFIKGGEVAIENYMNNFLIDHISKLTPLLDIIKTGVFRATNIIKSLNQFNRKGDSMMENCDIKLITKNCINILKSTMKDKVEVEYEYDEKEYELLANEGELHQLFLNILTNSEQAISGSGKIKISTSIETSYLVTKIEDTGVGISPEDIKRVTEPFFTTKAPGKGTGLGMSIVYSIISAHKGEIQIDSELGKGTAITIMLPIK